QLDACFRRRLARSLRVLPARRRDDRECQSQACQRDSSTHVFLPTAVSSTMRPIWLAASTESRVTPSAITEITLSASPRNPPSNKYRVSGPLLSETLFALSTRTTSVPDLSRSAISRESWSKLNVRLFAVLRVSSASSPLSPFT